MTWRLGWGLQARPGQQRPRSVAGAGWECQSRPVCLCKPPSHRRQRLTGVSCHSSVSRLRRRQQAAKAALQPSRPSSSDESGTKAKRGHLHRSQDAMWNWSEIYLLRKKTKNTLVVACSSKATHFLKEMCCPLHPLACRQELGQ